MSSETYRLLRHARGKDETLKAHKQHCAIPSCLDCMTLKSAARAAWAAWKQSQQADREPAPGQEVLF